MCCKCTPGDLGTQINDYLFNRGSELENSDQAQTDLTRFEGFASNEMSSEWVSVQVSEIAGFLRQQPIEDRSRVYKGIIDFFDHLGERGIVVHPPFLMNDPSPLQIANGS